MNRFILFAATLLILLATACGKSDTYSIEGEILGLGTQNLRLIYIDDEAVHTAQATALDGKFRFEGNLSTTSVMHLYSSVGAPLATFIVTPGDEIKCRISLDNTADDAIEGSDMTRRLVDFIHTGLTNASIDSYVATHTDDPVSSVLVTSYYDAAASTPAHIDSIISMIAPEARLPQAVIPYSTLLRPGAGRLPAKASLYTADADTFVNISLRGKTPRLLIINTTAERSATVDTLKKYADRLKAKNITVIDYTIAPDTVSWKAALRTDTLPGKFIHTYSPGALADPLMMQLGVTRHPLYIAADTSGLILLSTPDLATALRAIK